MIVYWDLVALWNFLLDYLLLLGTTQLAGQYIPRRRLAVAAGLGAAYSVASLTMVFSPWMMMAVLAAMCRTAFGRKSRWIRLTLLFALLSCALGGAVLLLGRVTGRMELLAQGLFWARLPWGVFCAASGLTYLLLALVFRAEAKFSRESYLNVVVEYGGRQVTARLFRDTGNTLSDPMTGEGVPVIEAAALEPLFSESGSGKETTLPALIRLRCHTLGAPETELFAFRCDRLTAGKRELGARLIALSSEGFGGSYQGLWFGEEAE